MGTSWSLHAVSVGVNARALALQIFDDVINQMSQWQEGSEISQFHHRPVGEWFPISPEFLYVLQAGFQISTASGGAFHPMLGRLSEAWGFGSKSSPNQDDARSLLKPDLSFTHNHLEIDVENSCIRRMDEVQIDLSAIAKGFAVDLLADRLRSAGVRHYMIEIGGELRGEGVEPNGQPWWVDIEMPPTSQLPPYRLALHGLSVATSGNYRRGMTIDGEYYSHSFDPRTGLPIRHAVTSVSVIHASCMLADAWATAMTVLTQKEAIALAEKQKLALCYVEGDREFISSKWQEMLED